jgi:hypothetical protein
LIEIPMLILACIDSSSLCSHDYFFLSPLEIDGKGRLLLGDAPPLYKTLISTDVSLHGASLCRSLIKELKNNSSIS